MPRLPSDGATPESEQPSSVDEFARMRRELEAAVARAERLQRQRDEARVQRDEARLQRDDAREQRDNLGWILETTAGTNSAPKSGPGGKSKRIGERARAPVGFAALPRSDLPSRSYSFGKYGEREKARLQIERRLKSRADASQPMTLVEKEIRASRKVPRMRRYGAEVNQPGPDVAFVTVADIAFFPGLLGLILSLLDVYPDFSATVFVYHDGSISRFAQERLIDVYANIEFVEPDMSWLDLSVAKLTDAKRIGKLGYMKFLALALSGYRRVIVLDSDLLILDDISALWADSDDNARASYDLGNREFAIKSDLTDAWIINSGVISLPGGWCTAQAFAEAQALIKSYLEPRNDLLDQFADQKLWNIYLSRRPLTYLEVNFNCNVKYAGRFLGGKLEGVSVLHFAGPKPWNSDEYLPYELLAKSKSMACVFPNLWINRYRALLFKDRSLSFRADMNQRLLRHDPADARRSAACMLTDDWSRIGPDEIAFARESDVVHIVRHGLPAFVEELAPRHIVFASHEYLGGWNTLSPSLPADCAERLGRMAWKPIIWAPYYFKPLFEVIARKHGLQVHYVLHEAPFVRESDDVGAASCRIDGYLDSCGDDTLTFGAPIACSLGYQKIVAVRESAAARAGDELGPDAGNDGSTATTGIGLVVKDLHENGVELVFSGSSTPMGLSSPPAGRVEHASGL